MLVSTVSGPKNEWYMLAHSEIFFIFYTTIDA